MFIYAIIHNKTHILNLGYITYLVKYMFQHKNNFDRLETIFNVGVTYIFQVILILIPKTILWIEKKNITNKRKS